MWFVGIICGYVSAKQNMSDSPLLNVVATQMMPNNSRAKFLSFEFW